MLSMICWELLGLGWSNLHWLVLLDPPKRSIGRYDQHQSSRLHNSLANARKGFTFQWHWQRPCTVAFCEKVSWQFFYSTLEQSSNTFSACPFMIMEVYILPKIPCDKVHSLSDNAKAMPYRRPPRKSGNTLFSTIGSCGSAHTIHHLDIQIPTINGPKDVWPTLWGPCLHDVAKYTCCCNSCSCSWTCHKIWKRCFHPHPGRHEEHMSLFREKQKLTCHLFNEQDLCYTSVVTASDLLHDNSRQWLMRLESPRVLEYTTSNSKLHKAAQVVSYCFANCCDFNSSSLPQTAKHVQINSRYEIKNSLYLISQFHRNISFNPFSSVFRQRAGKHAPRLHVRHSPIFVSASTIDLKWIKPWTNPKALLAASKMEAGSAL